ncbi:MAG: hypothetical protein AAF206_04920 [Bacteroidota bacterium]
MKNCKSLLLMLCLSILSLSIGAQNRQLARPAKTPSGETIFRAVFFAEGALAKKIPQINGLQIGNFVKDPAQLRKVQKLRTAMIQYIRKSQPAFFGQFKKQMLSKNPAQVKRGLTYGSQMYKKALAAVSKVRPNTQLEGKIRGMMAQSGNKALTGSQIAAELRKPAMQRSIRSQSIKGDGGSQSGIVVDVHCVIAVCQVILYVMNPLDYLSTNQSRLYTEQITLNFTKIEFRY